MSQLFVHTACVLDELDLLAGALDDQDASERDVNEDEYLLLLRLSRELHDETGPRIEAALRAHEHGIATRHRTRVRR